MSIRRYWPALVGVGLVIFMAVLPLLNISIPGILPTPTYQPGTLALLSLCMVFASLALSYNLLLGTSGMLSFGHALYFGAGAYGLGIALEHFGVPLFPGVFAALIGGMIIAFVTGAVAMRVSGIPFAMVTLAFAQAGSVLVRRNSAITGGEARLEGAKADDMSATLHALRNIGVHVESDAKGVHVAADGKLKAANLSTAPYPGLATDMQAQLMALLTVAEGTSVLTETIFENRYMHVPELNRMGANIEVSGRTAIVHGVEGLTGAEVMATDLRASMSLVIAALAAKGETQIRRIYHLDRGFERLEEKLTNCGAEIERISD